MDSPHVPQIFDRHRRAQRYARAIKAQDCGGAGRFLYTDMEEDVLDGLAFMQAEAGRALVIGDLTDTLGPELKTRGFSVRRAEPGALNEELPLPGSDFDYIVSLATLDTVNDLPGALLHVRAALAEGGLLMAQMVGAGSLPTLRKIMLAADGDHPAGRLHPQVDSRSAAGLLQRARFSRQVVDSRSLEVRYSTFERLIRDLRDQALTGILSDRPPPLTRAAFGRAQAAFDALREDDGRVTERFEILALTGWR